MSNAQNFWSRRKAAVEAEELALLQEQTQADEQTVRQELEEKSDAEVLEALDLPDPDTLSLGDDFTGFMAKAVPERLQRRALRRLWVSNPTLANLDSLVDYGEDFTDAATVVENMQTTYQVGKGMLQHVEEMARQAEELAQKDKDASTEDDGTGDDSTGDDNAEDNLETSEKTSESVAENEPLAAQDTDVETAAQYVFEDTPIETDLPHTAPGRMRFDFA